MTTAGLIFMILSWSTIIGLVLFCFAKTLSEKKEKIVGTLEVEAEIDREDREAGN
ncbi:MAG: hypothetical protein ACQEQV_03290 [Fibrobacterota bacterium]